MGLDICGCSSFSAKYYAYRTGLLLGGQKIIEVKVLVHGSRFFDHIEYDGTCFIYLFIYICYKGMHQILHNLMLGG